MTTAPDELGVLGKEIDGRYRLVRFIGAGTMGAVYEGTQLAVGRRVAVKLLNAALQTHQEVRDRFRVEAQAIASLSHPNCVTLYDFGFAEDLGSLYMAVEFLDGRSLDRCISDGLPPRTALSLSRQIADVLVTAHGAGIMHRDLKPENVMVIDGADGSAQAKVLDFGLARIFEDATGGARLTRQGQLFGTPAYMSPEQCKSAMDVGPPADIYALGVSMFEMVMGRLPFESPSVPELLVLHSTKTAPPVAVSDEIPIEVSALIARMMAKNPEDRPTARDVVAILDAVLEGRTAPALPPPTTVSGEVELNAVRATLAIAPASDDATSTGLALQPQRNLAIPALIVAALLLLGAAGVAVTMGEDEPLPAVASAPAALEPVPTSAAPQPQEFQPEFEIAPELATDQGALLAAELASAASTFAAEQAQLKPSVVNKPPVVSKQPIAAEKSRPLKDRVEERRKQRQQRLRSLGGTKHLYE